ncbi:MAG: FAD-binding oxidoreductase [Bacilli bacterium]
MSSIIKEYQESYQKYLKDESSLVGTSPGIALVKTTDEIVSVVKMGIPLKIQGNQTGLVGGATPIDQTILNLSQFNKIINFEQDKEEYLIEVQAGTSLLEINNALTNKSFPFENEATINYLKDNEYFLPINPTELSATIGGIIASDAKGSYHDFYGGISNYINELTFCFASGSITSIKRNEYCFKNNSLSINDYTINLEIEDDYDLIDLIIGSEGIFGLIISAKLRVIKKPSIIWGLGFFFEDDNVFTFIDYINNLNMESIKAFEYLDHNSIKLHQAFKEENTSLQDSPHIDEIYTSLVYLELHASNDELMERDALILLEQAISLTNREDNTWALSTEQEITMFNRIRHSIPEAINHKVALAQSNHYQIHKLSSDIYHYNASFQTVIKDITRLINPDLEYYLFGHVKGCHFHLNLVAHNQKEFHQAQELMKIIYITYQKENLFFEHGIGQLKKVFYQEYAPYLYQRDVQLKKQLDPLGIFNVGNKIV